MTTKMRTIRTKLWMKQGVTRRGNAVRGGSWCTLRVCAAVSGNAKGNAGSEAEGEAESEAAFAARVAARGDEMIGSILAEVSNACFFEDMRAGVSNAAEDVAAARAARTAALDVAIEQRIEELDDAFMLALEAYIGACERAVSYASASANSGAQQQQQQQRQQPPASADQMRGLLETLYEIREKVVSSVRASLPAEVRAIEYLITIRDGLERENTMGYAVGIDAAFNAQRPYSHDCPRVTEEEDDDDARGDDETKRDDTAAGARDDDDDYDGEEEQRAEMETQKSKREADARAQRMLSGLNTMIGDMEVTRDVPDARMLAQLVLLRDMMRRHVVDEALMASGNVVSRQEMAFMKELLAVGDATRRKAIIRDAFGDGKDVRLPRSESLLNALDDDETGNDAPIEGDMVSLQRMFASKLSRRQHNGNEGGTRRRQDVENIMQRENQRLEQERERDIAVRPGRFFDAARLLEAELKLEGIRFSGGIGPEPPPPPSSSSSTEADASSSSHTTTQTAYEPLMDRARKNAVLTRRLTDVLADARAVLDAVAGYT